MFLPEPLLSMKKFRFSILCFVLVCCPMVYPAPCLAELSPALWDSYLALAQNARSVSFSHCPGRLLRSVQAGSAAFSHAWKYRKTTYELHFDSRQTLGRTVYDLALHSGDIPPTVSRERVEAGVEGFHYSTSQICAWLNDVFAGKRETPVRETLLFIGYLVQDQVVVLKEGRFIPGGKIGHVLAAAEGKKRSLEENLNHERLHVFWDEDPFFMKQARKAWNALSEPEREQERNRFKQYADNEELRLEEWAVREVQARRIILKGF